MTVFDGHSEEERKDAQRHSGSVYGNSSEDLQPTPAEVLGGEPEERSANTDRSSVPLELWQAEGRPHSGEVSETLSELGVPFVARQAPAELKDRDEMERAVGTRETPAVRLADGTVLDGDPEAIVAALRDHFAHAEDAGAQRHKPREKA